MDGAIDVASVVVEVEALEMRYSFAKEAAADRVPATSGAGVGTTGGSAARSPSELAAEAKGATELDVRAAGDDSFTSEFISAARRARGFEYEVSAALEEGSELGVTFAGSTRESSGG